MSRFALFCLLLLCCASVHADSGKHLFILSGQSNMGGLKPDESFTPTVEEAFGKENVVVVYAAWGGQPIRRWYKNWKPAQGEAPDKLGDLYDQLMEKVSAATKDQVFASTTFIWMQGERDAREQHGNVYEASL
ncbi:MAG: sialate O-acetylesterase, partial [Planctomycetota bacterium]